MTLSEFKAWFEGFTEDMDGPPSAKQWKRIKTRIKEVDDMPTTERIFIERWVRPYRPYWSEPVWFSSAGSTTGGMTIKNSAADRTVTANQLIQAGKAEFLESTA